MRRSVLFEAVLVLLLIALLSILYVAVMSGRGEDTWTVEGVIKAPDNYFYQWSGPGNSNMFPGDDGTLYTFDGSAVHALSGDGKLLWSCDIPVLFSVNDSGRVYNLSLTGYSDTVKALSAATRDGYLYLLVGSETHAGNHGMLLAISPDGRIIWHVPFIKPDRNIYPSNYATIIYPVHVQVNNDVIMVFSMPSGLTMISLNGSVLRTIDDIISVPSVDEEGIFYVRNGTLQIFNGYGLYVNSSVNAYFPDGSLKWQKSYDTVGMNDSIDYTPWQLLEPLYHNGTLYVWSNDGIMALDRSGGLKWETHIDGSNVIGYSLDRNDTLYLSYVTNDKPGMISGNSKGIMTIASDGRLLDDRSSENFPFIIHGPGYAPDGIYYSVTWEPPGIYAGKPNNVFWNYSLDYQSVIGYLREHGDDRESGAGGLNDLWRPVVTAYDLRTGELLWDRALSQVRHETLLTPDNAGGITIDSRIIEKYNAVAPEAWYQTNGIPQGSKGYILMPLDYVLVSNDTIYANVWSYSYEVPAFYNRSRCVFAGGIYALYRDGRIIWARDTDTRVVGMQELNGTVFFGSGDGKVSAIDAGLIGGAIAAASYLFYRFFIFGAVARARTRLDRNGNRNRILEYIRKTPGASMFEIARDLSINMGTVRYHLLILSLNHKIVPFRADEKYVRYFTNAGTYRPGDQLIISLMRREPLKKIMIVLQEQPGLSNLELSRALDAHESSTMRNIKVLIEKGVVNRSLRPDGKITYSLDSEYCTHAVSAFKLLDK